MPPPAAINIDEFALLYRQYGETKTWVEYAKMLSERLNRRITPNQVTAWVARNREQLLKMGIEIKARRVSAVASGHFPWPTERCRPFWSTYWSRYLFNRARVEALGVESLSREDGTRREYVRANKKLQLDRLVIRLNPQTGFYTDTAHDDETPGGPENIEYFRQRFPGS